MWKKYNYEELKGVIKVGDRVRAANDDYNPCLELEDDGSNEVCITHVGNERFLINGCDHPYAECHTLERWEEPQERTIEDVQEGDVIIADNGSRRKVFGRAGSVLFLSEINDLEVPAREHWWTIDYLKNHSFTLDKQKDSLKVTKQEIAEWKGVDVSLIDITE